MHDIVHHIPWSCWFGNAQTHGRSVMIAGVVCMLLCTFNLHAQPHDSTMEWHSVELGGTIGYHWGLCEPQMNYGVTVGVQTPLFSVADSARFVFLRGVFQFGMILACLGADVKYHFSQHGYLACGFRRYAMQDLTVDWSSCNRVDDTGRMHVGNNVSLAAGYTNRSFYCEILAMVTMGSWKYERGSMVESSVLFSIIMSMGVCLW